MINQKKSLQYKKFFLLFFTFLIFLPQAGNCEDVILEIEDPVIIDEIKPVKDILDFEDVIDNGQIYEKYYYKGEIVEDEKLESKGLREDVSKRKNNARFFSNGENFNAAKIYNKAQMIKEGDEWRYIEQATTTLKNWSDKVSRNFKKKWWINTASADSASKFSTLDGSLNSTGNANWTLERNKISASSLNANEISNSCYYYGGKYYVQRALLTFDTSVIGGNNVIDLGKIFMYGLDHDDSRATGVFTGVSDYGTLSTGDYNLINDTIKSDVIEFKDFTEDVYNTWTLNASGIDDIENGLDGKTFFSYRNYTYDVLNATPPTVSDLRLACHSSAYAGTLRDPYLYVEYHYLAPASTTMFSNTGTNDPDLWIQFILAVILAGSIFWIFLFIMNTAWTSIKQIFRIIK